MSVIGDIAHGEVTADPHPLEALYHREYQSLVRLASILIDDRASCEEIVQDAFVRTLVAWDRLRDSAKGPQFLRSAVLNGARSQLRRRAVVRRHPQAAPQPYASMESASVDHHILVRELRRLPGRQRDCVVLRYYLDLAERDIAATLGISPGSVKTHLHRGLAALAEHLEDR
ncbi:MAG: SigE family RNA polymerase sigma factor [Actinobacteria bacterium]|nr:SigE family RNA polymerase sigma factor [Actinomycetota bacterium]